MPQNASPALFVCTSLFDYTPTKAYRGDNCFPALSQLTTEGAFMKKLTVSLAASAVILLVIPMGTAVAKPQRRPPPTLQELLPRRAPDKVCKSNLSHAWAAAYLNHPKDHLHPEIRYLTIGYYFKKRLVIVAQVDIAQDQPLFIDFNQQDEPLIQALYKLGDETEFSRECENLGTQTLEVKK